MINESRSALFIYYISGEYPSHVLNYDVVKASERKEFCSSENEGCRRPVESLGVPPSF